MGRSRPCTLSHTAPVLPPVLSWPTQIWSASLPLSCSGRPCMCRVGIGSPLPDLTFRRLPSGLGLQKLKHELALWIPLRHTNTELTWGTWAASALLICRDNSRHTARPWCGLCPAAAWRERGFVLFSAHCWVALGGTMEYEFVHPGHRRPQARALPYTIRQPVPTPHQVAAVGQHRS